MTRYPEPDPMTGLPGAVIGALTGLVYGFVLWVLIAWLFEQIWPAVIGWCAAGFAVVGWFNGNVVFELTLALAHFIWGLLNGLAENYDFRPDRGAGRLLETVAIAGFVSGMAIWLAWYFR